MLSFLVVVVVRDGNVRSGHLRQDIDRMSIDNHEKSVSVLIFPEIILTMSLVDSWEMRQLLQSDCYCNRIAITASYLRSEDIGPVWTRGDESIVDVRVH